MTFHDTIKPSRPARGQVKVSRTRIVETNKEVKSTEKRLPPAAGKGRVAGTQNKLTKTIKEAIEASFDKVGGADYLARMADEQPVAYMALLAKVLPTQVKAEVSTPGYIFKIERAGA